MILSVRLQNDNNFCQIIIVKQTVQVAEILQVAIRKPVEIPAVIKYFHIEGLSPK